MEVSATLRPGLLVQVLHAKTKVNNGKVFDMAVKLSQGDLPDQIMQVRGAEAIQNLPATCTLLSSRHSP